MGMVDYSELEPEVLAVASTCPSITIERTFNNAARDLCKKAECYRVDLDNTIVIASQPTIELYLPQYTQLLKPVTLTVNGEQITATSDELLGEDDSQWSTRVGAAKKFMRSANDTNSIRLYPIPDTTLTGTGLRGTVAVQPTRSARCIAEVFLDRFQDYLVNGTLARLLMIQGSEWYNPSLGSAYAAQFNVDILAAKDFGRSDDLAKRRVTKYGGY